MRVGLRYGGAGSCPSNGSVHHALNLVATEVGFGDWAQARRVLSGHAHNDEDMGGLWYDYRCQLLLNHWFARYERARAFLGTEPTSGATLQRARVVCVNS